MAEVCRCEHTRDRHADHFNPLQAVPLAKTESDDAADAEDLPVVVRGAGECTVAGCGCRQFVADEG